MSYEIDRIAECLNIEEEILLLLPELLNDIWILGSWPQEIIKLLETIPVTSDSCIVELGCGKGAISIPIAKRFNCKVIGVDIYQPFLNEARNKAFEYKVEHLCEFINEEIQSFIDRGKAQFDIGILAAVGTIGSTMKETIFQFRKTVIPGGYFVIDDGYLNEGIVPSLKGYEYALPQREMLEVLKSYSDKIIAEKVIPRHRVKEYNEQNNIFIEKRAKEIIKRNPSTKKMIEAFVEKEKEECEFIEEKTIACIWLMRKSYN
jgi:ubiquinone/menaquinone biosynthesis C-methylase UbiE